MDQKLIFRKAFIDGLLLIEPTVFNDERGSFCRLFCKEEFENIGISIDIKQINISYNKFRGTIRGLHYQSPPSTESKIIRCCQGEIFDIAVDIRKKSKTYLSVFNINLSSENNLMLFIPFGFAHGFQILTNNVYVEYYHSDFFVKELDTGIFYKDKTLNIQWPLKVTNISERDKGLPAIDERFGGV